MISKSNNKGVPICEEWYNPNRISDGSIDIEGFRNFYNWAKMNGYVVGLNLFRINSDEGFSPENCRWVTSKEQLNSMETNRLIDFNGEKFTPSQLSSILGIKYNTFRSYMRRNDYDITALMYPVYTKYGEVQGFYGGYGVRIPTNAIYFVDKYGTPIPQDQYQDPPPTPVLWNCDDKGFITGPVLD